MGKLEKDISPLTPSFIKASAVAEVFPFITGLPILYSTVVADLNPQLAIIPLRYGK